MPQFTRPVGRQGRTPRAVEWGHACAAGWALLWVVAAVTHRDDGWALPVGLAGLVILPLIVFAARRSPRAWLLVELFTTLALLCATASLFVEVDDPDVKPFVVVTAAMQMISVVSLNVRQSRVWHRVDPEGWRTIFQ